MWLIKSIPCHQQISIDLIFLKLNIQHYHKVDFHQINLDYFLILLNLIFSNVIYYLHIHVIEFNDALSIVSSHIIADDLRRVAIDIFVIHC